MLDLRLSGIKAVHRTDGYSQHVNLGLIYKARGVFDGSKTDILCGNGFTIF